VSSPIVKYASCSRAHGTQKGTPRIFTEAGCPHDLSVPLRTWQDTGFISSFMRPSFFLSYSTGSLTRTTLTYMYVLGAPRLLPERCIYPATVANESSLHSVSSSVGYLLHGKESKGRHAWVGVYRRDSPDEDSASSLGDPLSRLGGPRKFTKHRPHRPRQQGQKIC
jgi:hypothetical protein